MSRLGKGEGGLDVVTLVHNSGATATIYLWGATLSSYRPSDGQERIFMSPGALFDGRKAIRGGVPVVFPQFGQPDKTMPQHGFARSSTWSLIEGQALVDTAEDSRVTLCLRDSDETLKIWPHKFELRYTVTLSAVSLTMSLVVMNTGNAPLSFQALLHTYFRVDDVAEVAVRGLAGRRFVDKVEHNEVKEQVELDVVLPTFTDRVFRGDNALVVSKGIPSRKDVLIYASGPNRLSLCAPFLSTVLPPEKRLAFCVSNSATIGGRAQACDVVVWNPYPDASPADLPPPAWRNFVCVEPGLVDESHTLAAQQEAVIGQHIFAM